MSATLDNTNGVTAVNAIAANLMDDYKFTTKSGTPQLVLGDKVRVESPEVDLDDGDDATASSE